MKISFNIKALCLGMFLAMPLLCQAQGHMGGQGPRGTGKRGDVRDAKTEIIRTSTKVTDKMKEQDVYMFGFAESFMDSTIYFTEIQKIPQAIVSQKDGLLMGRHLYSQQLVVYLNNQKVGNRLGVVCYNAKKSKVEKEFVRLKKKYSKNNEYLLRFIDPSDFSFNPIYINVNKE